MNNKIKRINDGNKNGYCEETSEDGSITKAYYIDGNPYGLVETFYPNGKLKYKFYALEGRIDKFCLIYYENGKLWKKWNLKNGKFHGQYKTFFENGQLETSKVFKEDKAS